RWPYFRPSNRVLRTAKDHNINSKVRDKGERYERSGRYDRVFYRCLLVIRRFPRGIIGFAIGLLPAFGAETAEILAPEPQIAQTTDRGAQPYDVIPELRGRPSPELPQVQPSPPPPSGLMA